MLLANLMNVYWLVMYNKCTYTLTTRAIQVHVLMLYATCSISWALHWCDHEDAITWKCFPHYWPFVRGTHWSLVDSPHKALMFSLLLAEQNELLNKQTTYNKYATPWLSCDPGVRVTVVKCGPVYIDLSLFKEAYFALVVLFRHYNFCFYIHIYIK